MTRRAAWRVVRAAPAIVALLSLPPLAHGQRGCPRLTAAESARRWPAPLDRELTISLRDVPLPTALERVAAAAHVRLSYSGDLLPPGRRACLDAEGVPLGDVLSAALHGSGLSPVAAGSALVVITPARAADAERAPSQASTAQQLDRVVVTGSAVGASQRALPIALDVIGGAQLERRGAGSVARALDDAVPGLWTWAQPPSSLLARYGSIRGASSFDASYPKIYIDGVQVANPLLLTTLLPEAVDRVEVIRGPQGAALYGADAISGVLNIVTRQRGAPDGGTLIHLRSGAGITESDFASRPALAQEHTLTLRAGAAARSLDVAVAGSGTGSLAPGIFARQATASGAARAVRAGSTLTGTFRVVAARAGTGTSPLLPDAGAGGEAAGGGDQRMVAYTMGATALAVRGTRWTHAAVVGVDGYRLAGVADDHPLLPLVSGGRAQLADGGADRGSVRLSSVGRIADGARGTATVTLALEHSTLRERIEPDGGGDADAIPSELQWRNNTGLAIQANASLHDALFLAGGLRLERDVSLRDADNLAVLPMVGASWVRERGGVTVKVRAAYGKGIRTARTSARLAMVAGLRAPIEGPNLAPEQQTGVEGGVDLYVGRAVTLHATRFDQLASGLIQRVGYDVAQGGDEEAPQLALRLENVGEIRNRGWELQAGYDAGPVAISTALSLVESRVRRLAEQYTGDLRPGDRMFAVPTHTATVTAEWNGGAWSALGTVTRATDWMGYDRVALAHAFADSGSDPAAFTGAALRGFWREYDGITHARLAISRTLHPGFAAWLSVDNLLDRQRGEPDNGALLPGRTTQVGVRADF